mmetsp:Transcript_96279/g.272147  ORF Transcript_96279/g.272147 Transcript_96279/m.272147 type:complete len:333 (-) Transcript_96279:118-1116(-)
MVGVAGAVADAAREICRKLQTGVGPCPRLALALPFRGLGRRIAEETRRWFRGTHWHAVLGADSKDLARALRRCRYRQCAARADVPPLRIWHDRELPGGGVQGGVGNLLHAVLFCVASILRSSTLPRGDERDALGVNRPKGPRCRPRAVQFPWTPRRSVLPHGRFGQLLLQAPWVLPAVDNRQPELLPCPVLRDRPAPGVRAWTRGQPLVHRFPKSLDLTWRSEVDQALHRRGLRGPRPAGRQTPRRRGTVLHSRLRRDAAGAWHRRQGTIRRGWRRRACRRAVPQRFRCMGFETGENPLGASPGANSIQHLKGISDRALRCHGEQCYEGRRS